MTNTILFVDDNPYDAYPYIAAAESDGFDVLRASTADEALEKCRQGGFSTIVLDVMMAPGTGMGPVETKGGFQTGIVLARQIRKQIPDIKLVALTNSQEPDIVSFFKKGGSVAYFHRQNTLPEELSRFLKSFVLGIRRSPRTMIVHGRDMASLFELKNFLQNILRFDEPTILFEKPSLGRTIIEKFEQHAHQVDLAFILMTPDDEGRLSSDPPVEEAQRARQNVIFECGYFFGYFRRQSGKVVLLYKGPIELPSDAYGMAYVDISRGIEAAGEGIRREISAWV
jgi:CheY-like chemotaxis protein